jgi:hypothetical protein
MASARQETVFASEGQKAGMKPHQVAIVFGDRRGQIIEPQAWM